MGGDATLISWRRVTGQLLTCSSGVSRIIVTSKCVVCHLDQMRIGGEYTAAPSQLQPPSLPKVPTRSARQVKSPNFTDQQGLPACPKPQPQGSAADWFSPQVQPFVVMGEALKDPTLL
jgi:hypothetical protein|mmetsp:Transcript_13361/g.22280  ORF Transcript_13361/g.22280 Transcript_13361/m.22280 type:complete len:118 (+) Transcript_13361:1469-1822(+)